MAQKKEHLGERCKMADVGSIQQAKLVLLGDMGAGKSSLVLRFVKGQFFDYQVQLRKIGSNVKPTTCWLYSSIQPDFDLERKSRLVVEVRTHGSL